MTRTQEHAVTLALNVLQVGFFECPNQYYRYFISDDEWALLLAAAGLTNPETSPKELALATLTNAVSRQGLFEGMTEFRPPHHFCSFLGMQMPATSARQTAQRGWVSRAPLQSAATSR